MKDKNLMKKVGQKIQRHRYFFKQLKVDICHESTKII